VPAPLAGEPPRLADPHTPRLARRVVLVVLDGLRADESHLPFLDELRARGASTTARTAYPSISRPNYATILTGVPPRDSGIRTNTVHAPTGVDTVMARVRAAGLRAVTASDYGAFRALFARPSARSSGGAAQSGGARPFEPDVWDDARHVDSLDELGATVGELVGGDAALVAILVLDIDKAGHAHGVGDDYRAAARAADAMLRARLAALDLSRDAIVITADHGHVARGGHGGLEPEVMAVPLVIAGAGVAPGTTARDAHLVDVAPTVAALLGVPAPGHAEGRALVEMLQLSPADAARRADADAARARATTAFADAAAAADDASRPEPLRLAAAAAVWLVAAALALALRRRGALRATSALGVTGFVAMLAAVALVLGFHASPSYVPTLARAELVGGIGAGVAIALHVAASVLVVRRAPDRLAAAIALAVVGLGVSLGTLATIRAWLSPPFVDVPPPLWLVGLPAVEIAAATCAAATTLVLLATLALSALASSRRPARPAPADRRTTSASPDPAA
jgi:hypothetical protein